jgi:RNA polymerase subunit RPABC4/transcription elongation factor Spt4
MMNATTRTVPRDACGKHTSKNWFGVYVVLLVGRANPAKGWGMIVNSG